MLLAGARTVINTSEPPNDQTFAGKHHDLRMTPDISETEKSETSQDFTRRMPPAARHFAKVPLALMSLAGAATSPCNWLLLGSRNRRRALEKWMFDWFSGRNRVKHPKKTSRNPWIPWFLAPTWVFPAEKNPPSPSSSWPILSKGPTAPHRSRRLDVIAGETARRWPKANKSGSSHIFVSGWWYTNPYEKYEFVSWDHYSQYMGKNMCQTTNQKFLLDRFKATVVIPRSGPKCCTVP